MLALIVNDAFEAAVNATAESLGMPIRLGSRLIDLGEHAGGRLVSCGLFGSCTEWQRLIQSSATGGTALDGGGIVIELGRTIQFTDPEGTTWGPFTVLDIPDADVAGMFNPPVWPPAL